MADQAGQVDIRGLDIDKLVKGFADEESIFKRYCLQTTTSAREIRFFTKTAGFLDSSDTTAITASQIANTAFRARPVIAGPSWTRNTAYVKKYFVESELISIEDMKDCDIDIIGTTMRDLTAAVENQVDARIYTVATTASGVQTGAATAAWNLPATCDPIKDILTMQQAIRAYRYKLDGAVIWMNSVQHKDLLSWLINVKGSSIPGLSSELAKSGVVMNILNTDIVVSENVTSGQVVMLLPQRSLTWKSFVPITAVKIEEQGIGVKIRVWEEGEAVCTDVKSVYVLTAAV